MSEQTYNGWTNYETWCVKLWLDNEQSSSYAMDEMAAEFRDEEPYRLGQAISEYVYDSLPDLGASMWADLLGSALDAVNWREIAEAYLEDLPDEYED